MQRRGGMMVRFLFNMSRSTNEFQFNAFGGNSGSDECLGKNRVLTSA